MNITPAQRKILRGLWERGSTLYFMPGLHAHFFESGTHQTIRYPSVAKLIKEGYLIRIKGDWRGSEYRLSDKGRTEAQC